MGLFDYIKRRVADIAVKRTLDDNPVLRATVIASNKTWNSLPLKDLVDEETRSYLSAQLVERIISVITADDPKMACRQHLADAVLNFAKYQVLVLEPDAEKDTTGLVGTQGITGELQAHLIRIAEADEELSEALYGSSHDVNFDDVKHVVQMMYWRSYWWAHTVNTCRIALKDFNDVDGRDWYKSFVHAMCAWQEDRFREELGLPSAIKEEDFSLTALQYSTFLDFVVSGAQYPDLSWKKQYSSTLEDGSLKPPFLH